MNVAERIEKKKARLAEVEIAISKVLAGQSYSLGTRSVTRADLSKLLAYEEQLEAEIEALEESGTTRRRFKRVVPIG